MKATDWEFKNRAMIFGLLFGISFLLYNVDPQNATAVLANWLGDRTGWNADSLARALFLCAAACCAVAAMLRTWASSYLDSSVVYAGKIQSVLLVADGPYRFVRNPLYLGNVIMTIAVGSMMSRSGFALAMLLMLVFCYRIIFREEAELQATQGEAYSRYRQTVPRMLPSPWPRVAISGHRPRWSAGFNAELWIWGFVLALASFALTLSLPIFFSIILVGVAIFWLRARG